MARHKTLALGAKAHNWKGAAATDNVKRARARRTFVLPPECQIRGCISEATIRHHINGDLDDWNSSNLVGLCRPCHNKVHEDDTCGAGHPKTPENWYIRPSGKGQCRTCLSERQRERNAARRGPNHTHGNAKLTNEQVEKIRAAYKAGGVKQKELAAQYGVVPSLISQIIHGRKRRIRAKYAPEEL